MSGPWGAGTDPSDVVQTKTMPGARRSRSKTIPEQDDARTERYRLP
jgi:hypothetical protein